MLETVVSLGSRALEIARGNRGQDIEQVVIRPEYRMKQASMDLASVKGLANDMWSSESRYPTHLVLPKQAIVGPLFDFFSDSSLIGTGSLVAPRNHVWLGYIKEHKSLTTRPDWMDWQIPDEAEELAAARYDAYQAELDYMLHEDKLEDEAHQQAEDDYWFNESEVDDALEVIADLEAEELADDLAELVDEMPLPEDAQDDDINLEAEVAQFSDMVAQFSDFLDTLKDSNGVIQLEEKQS